MVETLGVIAAVILPLWNIPLILRIRRRKSSGDVSLLWALGVWVCLLVMLPSGLTSAEPAFKAFTIVNLILFTVVVLAVARYRKAPTSDA